MIEYGYCQCGCGQKTTIPKKSCETRGIVKGIPSRYIHGHNGKWGKLEKHPDWNGGRYFDSFGYVVLRVPVHPNADRNGCVKEHVFIAATILGKEIPSRAVVHHINHDKGDNRNGNLVICEDRKYHHLLHDRESALSVCGHADWKACYLCHQYDDPINLYKRPNGDGGSYHRKCYNEKNYERIKMRRLKGRMENERLNGFGC